MKRPGRRRGRARRAGSSSRRPGLAATPWTGPPRAAPGWSAVDSNQLCSWRCRQWNGREQKSRSIECGGLCGKGREWSSIAPTPLFYAGTRA